VSAAPFASVIIPLKRANGYLRECLEHLAKQTFRDFDVFVVTDEPEHVAFEGLRLRCMSSGPVPPNVKRMMAARASDAQIVAFIDDDAYPKPEWLWEATGHFEAAGVVGVGGPGVTPPGDDAVRQASGAVYASPLVSGAYTYRYLPARLRDVDDLPSCNLMVRREPFLEFVPQCIRYWPGEDTKLCMLLTAKGARIVYSPAVAVFHHRRRLFREHMKQVWNYAMHRGFFVKRYPETSRRPAYFVPTAFVLANAALGAAALARSPARKPLALLAGVYCLAVGFEALRSTRAHRANPAMVAAGIYATHITYGIGFLCGLLRPELDH
jgi:glycosyltransferase involved in cell wall biosynthesis